MELPRCTNDACPMDDDPGLPQEWVPQLRRARRALTVADEVGLALRAHRRRLGMSQRAYASARGISRAMLARLEAGAGRMSLDAVMEVLEGTGFTLIVTVFGDDPDPTPEGGAAALAVACAGEGAQAVLPPRVRPEVWAPTDLVARVRGGSRRFPAHREVLAVTNPPMWWWLHEFFNGPSEEPKWYAPLCHLDSFGPKAADEAQRARGAA